MWKAYLEAERDYKALAKKSRTTDLEPIPVEDAMPERERRERAIRSFGALVQHPYKTPKPGSANLPCKECGLGVEAPEHRMPKPAKDAKRARMHRALDAVMDARGSAKDEDPRYEHAWNSASPRTRFVWLLDEFDDDDATEYARKSWRQLSPSLRSRISGTCISNSAV